MSQQLSSASAVLDAIQQRAQQGAPWPRTAQMASTIVSGDTWRQTHGSASDWLTEAASRTPHALNTFRRHMRVAEFVESKLPKEQIERLFDRDLPFGPLEVLMRLHDVDQEQATSLFPKVLEGSITYKKMLDIYQDAKAKSGETFQGRRAFAERGQQFEAKAIDCIKHHQDQFLGGLPRGTRVEFRTNTRGFSYGAADLLAIGNDFIDGFEIKLFGADDNRYVLIRTLEQISLMSTFYRQTWLIYPDTGQTQSSHKEFIDTLGVHLIRLELTSVGVAQISEDLTPTPSIRIYPEPQQAPRQHLLRDFLRGR
jgi:hypothetical protein